MLIYLVGGAVRDELLGRPVKDRDYVVFGADEDDFKQRFPNARKVGKKTPVFILEDAQYTLSRFKNIEEDLLHRDLTINSLAREETGKLIAHPLALTDLEQKILRPVSRKNFYADPLRVFRVARFAATLKDFALHSSLLPILKEFGQRPELLQTISPERVGQEFLKALAGEKPARFLYVLDESACFVPWFKELACASKIPAGPKPYHDESLLEHLGQVMDKLRGHPLRVFMGLAHDLGKTLTPKDNWPRHINHDKLGESLAYSLATRLKLPKQFILAGQIAARWHMVGGRYDQLRPGTKVDLLNKLGPPDLIEFFFTLVKAENKSDFLSLAQKDWEKIKKVHLPPKFHYNGPKAGEMLRVLQAQQLARQ
ncbi:tRNA nucleotidyltransferase [Desulfovulcanus sp.]